MRAKGKHDKEKEPWSRSDKISLASFAVALIGLIKEYLN